MLNADGSMPAVGTVFQFERLGYFVVDPDTTAQRLVLNRVVSLKESGKLRGGRYYCIWHSIMSCDVLSLPPICLQVSRRRKPMPSSSSRRTKPSKWYVLITDLHTSGVVTLYSIREEEGHDHLCMVGVA